MNKKIETIERVISRIGFCFPVLFPTPTIRRSERLWVSPDCYKTLTILNRKFIFVCLDGSVVEVPEHNVSYVLFEVVN